MSQRLRAVPPMLGLPLLARERTEDTEVAGAGATAAGRPTDRQESARA